MAATPNPKQELAKIDAQLKQLAELRHRWVTAKELDPKATSPIDASRAIDDLLLERHRICRERQGEHEHRTDDVASTEEWGDAG
jgi:hypothetical protein